MLRITTERNENSFSMKLEGRVEGAWIEVLRKAWTDATSLDGGRKVVADLGGVNFADREGRTLLLTMQKQGVTLTRLSGFMREVLGRNVSEPNNKSVE